MFRLEIRLLRSTAMAWFAAGALVGLVFISPIVFSLYLWILARSWTFPLFPVASGDYISMRITDPELNFSLRHVLNEGMPLVIGSSEMRPIDGHEGLDHYITRCMGSPKKTVEFLHPEASAIFRAVMLLERVNPGKEAIHLVVLSNIHYALHGSDRYPPLELYFYNQEAIRYRAASQPGSKLAMMKHYGEELRSMNNLSISPFHLFLKLRVMEISILRDRMGRTLVQPVRNLLFYDGRRNEKRPSSDATFNAEWGVMEQFIPPAPTTTVFKKEKEIYSRGEITPFEVSLQLLSKESRKLAPGSRIDLLLLPINVKYFSKLGVDPLRLEKERLRIARLQAGRSPVIQIKNLHYPQAERDFYDSIHWSDSGRNRLAKKICEAVQGDR